MLSEVVIETGEKSDEWRRKHLATIGGSNAGAAVGRSRFKTPHKLWTQMHSVIVDGNVPKPAQIGDDMRRGGILEPVARQLLAERLGVSIRAHDQDRFMYRDDCPWAHALPDGWIADDIVELKVPRPGTIAKVNMNGLIAEWTIQAHHNMHVASATRPNIRQCHMGLLDPMSCIVHYFTVVRDEIFETLLMRQEREFFEGVQRSIEPIGEDSLEPDPDAAERAYLDDSESHAAAVTWLRLHDVAVDCEEAIEVVSEKLRKQMGKAELADIPIGDGMIVRCRWKQNAPSKYLHKASLVEHYPKIADDKRVWKMTKTQKKFSAKVVKA